MARQVTSLHYVDTRIYTGEYWGTMCGVSLGGIAFYVAGFAKKLPLIYDGTAIAPYVNMPLVLGELALSLAITGGIGRKIGSIIERAYDERKLSESIER